MDDIVVNIPDPSNFVTAISNQHWPLLVALILTVIVYIFRLFYRSFESKYIPYLTLTCTLIASTTSRVIQYSIDDLIWWHGLIYGFLEGITIATTSMGLWSSIVKPIVNKATEKE